MELSRIYAMPDKLLASQARFRSHPGLTLLPAVNGWKESLNCERTALQYLHFPLEQDKGVEQAGRSRVKGGGTPFIADP